MTKIKGAIFDLDGTLFQSTGVWRQIDIDFLKKRGFDEVPADYVETITPMEFRQIADYTIERFGLKERAEDIMDEWNRMALDAYTNDVPLKKGVKEFLQEISDAGIQMGVATSNIANLYMPCLTRNGIVSYFHSYTECGDVGKGKRFPDIYIEAARKLGCLPEECLVFEDITDALQTAKKAGFVTVCARDEAWDYDEEFLKEIADYQIHDFSEALSLINLFR
ncbi:MAG: HAD family phosphatase [Eubacterium sp.]|nr:HAD family phosphatase [Eubacterium sp.]